jgi:hypothetical protein
MRSAINRRVRRTYPRDVAAAMATELLADAKAAPLLLDQAR